MQVKIKKLHPDAVIPKYAKDGDAGLDLTAVGKYFDQGKLLWVYHTGIQIEIPKGYVGLVFPRSSIANVGIRLSNCVGVIDSGYRGEILAKFDVAYLGADLYKLGDRIAQLIIMPYPEIEFVEVDELSQTERCSGGYGSTNV